jgi:hypothetical protein
MELADALNKVTEDALKEQEQEQQMQEQMMSPEQAASGATVQAMTGGNPQGPSPIPGATPGQASLGDLLSTLRRPTQTIQPMRGVNRGAV